MYIDKYNRFAMVISNSNNDIKKNRNYALNKFPDDNPIKVCTHSSFLDCNPWHPPSVCLFNKLIRLKVL